MLGDGKKLRVGGIIESCLYVDDLVRAREFYTGLMGFSVAGEILDRLCPLKVNDAQVLLLFLRGASTHPIPTSGGVIPPSDGSGPLHVTFSISPLQWEEWLSRLASRTIPVESLVEWPTGGKSIYFRDPDNHLVELKTSPWNSDEFAW